MEALRRLEAFYANLESSACSVRAAGRASSKVAKRVVRSASGSGLVEGIEALCSALDLELSDDRRQQLAAWDIPSLKTALAEIATSRRWPES